MFVIRTFFYKMNPNFKFEVDVLIIGSSTKKYIGKSRVEILPKLIGYYN